ncbi:MAG TPA: helix-turn-helix transcriptional regulator [Sandaracinaceae bacterium]
MSAGDDAEELGARIREAYEAAGLNRSQFVRALGVAYSTVLHWEHGKTRPNADNLRRICEITGVSMSRLLEGRRQSRASSEPPEALARFLRTALGRTATDAERRFLLSLDFGDVSPALESYHAALLSLRLGHPRSSPDQSSPEASDE